MSEKVLFVDDDQNILRSYKRTFGFDFDIEIALGGHAGLKQIEQGGPYAVVVSDMRMPQMDGTAFLGQVRERWPDTVRMLLTGHADLTDAIAVVNQGQIFRFLTKPCPPEVFSRALKDALAQYRLVTSEKELLGKTLRGSVKLLMDILSVVNPSVFSHSTEIRKLAIKLAKRQELDNLWQVDLAALLSHIGCVTVPREILVKKFRGEMMTETEQQQYLQHIEKGYKLVVNIPRLEQIAEAIRYQQKSYSGEGPPPDDKVKGPAIPMLGRLLKVVIDFDDQMTQGHSPEEAYRRLLRQKSNYDPNIFQALKVEVMMWQDDGNTTEVKPAQVQVGMVVAEDVKTDNRLLLVKKGQEISEAMQMCIINYAQKNCLKGPLKVVSNK